MSKIASCASDQLSWINNIKTIAILAVILLHSSAPLLYEYGQINKSYWWFANLIDSACRFCVPIFLMVSGATILTKRDSIKEYIKKRVSRILPPFIFWSSVYIVYSLYIKRLYGVHMNINEIIDYGIVNFRNGAAYHFWYIYMLLELYFFFPIISVWLAKSNEKQVRYVLFFWFAFLLFYQIQELAPKSGFDIGYLWEFIGYPILGYYLSKFDFKHIHKKVPLLLFIIGFGSTAIGTYYFTAQKSMFDGRFYAFISPNVLIASTGIFLFFKEKTIQNKKILSTTNSVNKYSYGIYLSHLLVLLVLARIGIKWSFFHPIVGILLTFSLCFLLSLSLIFFLRKIKYSEYLIG